MFSLNAGKTDGIKSVSVVINIFRLPHVNCRKPVVRRKEKGRFYFFYVEQVVFEQKQVKYNSATWCYSYWNGESLWTVYCKGRNVLDFYLVIEHVPEALKLDTNFYKSKI